MSFDPEQMLAAYGPDGDPAEAMVAADWFLERGDLPMAATAMDRAFGLDPDNEQVAKRRANLLDGLAMEEHGLRFRYVPAGSFLMGAQDGDPDERPVHPVRVPAFYLADIPTTWADYCRLMEWTAPPRGMAEYPEDLRDRPWEERAPYFHLNESNKIRNQYCEPYDRKPMVAVSPEEAEDLAVALTSEQARYALPSEAQWEKAARGGRIGAPYAWGHAPPTQERCDFGHFGVFKIGDPRLRPPNGYGLYGMCGGVWEWTADGYWALAYQAAVDPRYHRPEELPERALRGGSWADCAHMVRVSARMSRPGGSWRAGEWSGARTPNVGFRLCRAVPGDR